MYPTNNIYLEQTRSSERFSRVPAILPYLRNSSRRQVTFPRKQSSPQVQRIMFYVDPLTDPPGGVPAMLKAAH
jgi:hypothetical protein